MVNNCSPTSRKNRQWCQELLEHQATEETIRQAKRTTPPHQPCSNPTCISSREDASPRPPQLPLLLLQQPWAMAQPPATRRQINSPKHLHRLYASSWFPNEIWHLKVRELKYTRRSRAFSARVSLGFNRRKPQHGDFNLELRCCDCRSSSWWARWLAPLQPLLVLRRASRARARWLRLLQRSVRWKGEHRLVDRRRFRGWVDDGVLGFSFSSRFTRVRRLGICKNLYGVKERCAIFLVVLSHLRVSLSMLGCLSHYIWWGMDSLWTEADSSILGQKKPFAAHIHFIAHMHT